MVYIKLSNAQCAELLFSFLNCVLSISVSLPLSSLECVYKQYFFCTWSCMCGTCEINIQVLSLHNVYNTLDFTYTSNFKKMAPSLGVLFMYFLLFLRIIIIFKTEEIVHMIILNGVNFLTDTIMSLYWAWMWHFRWTGAGSGLLNWKKTQRSLLLHYSLLQRCLIGITLKCPHFKYFNYSRFNENLFLLCRNIVRCLEHCVQQLTQLTGLLDAILTKCCNLVIPDGMFTFMYCYQSRGWRILKIKILQ